MPLRSLLELLPIIFCLAALAKGALIPRQDDSPSVTVKNGTFHGLHNPTYDQDLFLGMPFAQPPVGDLRFRNPVSLNRTWIGSKNATEYGKACYGYGSDDWVLGNPVSEDCLTINVVRPSGTRQQDQLPVGVWIHGGGGYMGSSLDPRYNLSFIVEQSVEMGTPFIGVSLNYRLQAFGYIFGSTVLKAGVTNIGYRDQRMALHWVQENIAAFGGDPAKVTIWGESAGASSVGAQLLAYGGRDDKLFRGAIQESGGHISSSRQVNASTWDKYYNNITEATNCTGSSDTLACLRKVPIEALNAVLNSSVTASVPYWGANVDDDFIVATGTRSLLDGKFVKVPLLHGRNFDVGAFPSRKS
jgi:carboxylesterase type B